jgi:hypothetical protein
MNRFSQILNESTNPQELKDQFSTLQDILGEPQTATIRFGDKIGYVFRWSLDFNIGEYQGETEMENMLKVFEIIRSVVPNIKMKDYDVEFKIDEYFYVRLTPRTEDLGEGYKFVVGQNWRNIIIDYGQVSKFFKDRGFSIRSSKSNEEHFSQSSHLVIKTDADFLTTNQFANKLNEEINHLYNEEESINLLAECKVSDNVIFITPDEDKTYVIFDR